MGDATGPRVLAFATQGSGGDDELRLRGLLDRLAPAIFPFRRGSRLSACLAVLREIRRERPDVVVMEGTGIGGGLGVILGRLLHGTRYVVSSGDAVGPFVAAHHPIVAPFFATYERLLCRWSSGFIGWSPYLVGRALTFGAPRGVTAPGWAPFPPPGPDDRARVRARLGIAPDAIVVGIVGSLAWARRAGYCYGLELVRALERVRRPDVVVLIVGDGDGRAKLESLAGARAGRSIVFTGRVERAAVPEHLAAMDLASLPQSVDKLGSFRYTTKLAEYFSAGLPVVTSRIPLGYDLDQGAFWRLPGDEPWGDEYVAALAALLESLEPEELRARAALVPRASPLFDRDAQVARVTSFIREIV